MRVLLLIGSAKTPHSTSESLGTYLLGRLQERSFETETILIHRALRTDETTEDFLSATDQAEMIVLAFPLYIDSLPYSVIRALELIARHRNATGKRKGQRLICIVNCGFPEAHHTDSAIAICRRFAFEAGFEWSGGLGLGGGETINAKPLGKLGGMVRNVLKSLDLTADAIAEGKPVPQEAISLMARPLVPKWLYILFGGIGWQLRARRHGAQRRLRERPYEKND